MTLRMSSSECRCRSFDWCLPVHRLINKVGYKDFALFKENWRLCQAFVDFCRCLYLGNSDGNDFQVQDIWIHVVTLSLCLATMGVAIYQLCKTFDRHSYQSISVLVSSSLLPLNMIKRLHAMSHPASSAMHTTTKDHCAKTLLAFVSVDNLVQEIGQWNVAMQMICSAA